MCTSAGTLYSHAQHQGCVSTYACILHSHRTTPRLRVYVCTYTPRLCVYVCMYTAQSLHNTEAACLRVQVYFCRRGGQLREPPPSGRPPKGHISLVPPYQPHVLHHFASNLGNASQTGAAPLPGDWASNMPPAASNDQYVSSRLPSVIDSCTSLVSGLGLAKCRATYARIPVLA